MMTTQPRTLRLESLEDRVLLSTSPILPAPVAEWNNLAFDGTEHQVVNLGDRTEYELNDFTLHVEATPERTHQYGAIISLGYQMASRPGTSGTLLALTDENRLMLTVGKHEKYPDEFFSKPLDLQAGETYSIDLVKAGTNATVYLDGESVLTAEVPADIDYTSDDKRTMVGGLYDHGRTLWPFLGQMHSVELYAQSFTDELFRQLDQESELGVPQAFASTPSPADLSSVSPDPVAEWNNLSFDGTERQVVNLGDRPEYELNDFTLHVEATPERTHQYGAIISLGYQMASRPGTSGTLLALTDENRLMLTVGKHEKYPDEFLSERLDLQAGETYSIDLVKAGTTATVYLDGESVLTAEVPEDIDYTSDDKRTMIGGLYDHGRTLWSFQGQMETVRLFDEVLTPEQVKGVLPEPEVQVPIKELVDSLPPFTGELPLPLMRWEDLSFKSPSEVVDLGDDPRFQLDDFTVAFQLTPREVNRYTALFSMNMQINQAHDISGVFVGITEQNELILLAASDQTGPFPNVKSGSIPLQAGQQYEVVFVKVGKVGQLYLDGELVGTGELPEQVDYRSNGRIKTSIGGAWSQSSNGFVLDYQGDLDDVRVFGSALSAEQVNVLFRSESGEMQFTQSNLEPIATTGPNLLLAVQSPYAERYVWIAGGGILSSATTVQTEGRTLSFSSVTINSELPSGTYDVSLMHPDGDSVLDSVEVVWDAGAQSLSFEHESNDIDPTVLNAALDSFQSLNQYEPHQIDLFYVGLREERNLDLFERSVFAGEGSTAELDKLVATYRERYQTDYVPDLHRNYYAYREALGNALKNVLSLTLSVRQGHSETAAIENARASYEAVVGGRLTIELVLDTGLQVPTWSAVLREGLRMANEEMSTVLNYAEIQEDWREQERLDAMRREPTLSELSRAAFEHNLYVIHSAHAQSSPEELRQVTLNYIEQHPTAYLGYLGVARDDSLSADEQVAQLLQDAFEVAEDKIVTDSGDVLTPMTRESLSRIRDNAQTALESALIRNDSATIIEHFEQQIQAANGLLALIPIGSDVPVIDNSPETLAWKEYIERTTSDPLNGDTHLASQATSPRDLDNLRSELQLLNDLRLTSLDTLAELRATSERIDSELEQGSKNAAAFNILFNYQAAIGDRILSETASSGAVEDFVVEPVLGTLDAGGRLPDWLSYGLLLRSGYLAYATPTPLSLGMFIGEAVQDLIVNGVDYFADSDIAEAERQIEESIASLERDIVELERILLEMVRAD